MAENPAQMSKTKAIFLTVFLVFMTAAPFLMAGKQLVSDFVNGPKWEMALDLTITEAKCTRYAFVIARCTTRFASVSQPALVQPILEYFSFGSWGGEVAILTRSAKSPQAITTQLAIRDLNLRLVSMCVWALAGLALTLAFVIKVFAPGRSHRIETAPSRLSRDLPSSRAAFGGFAPPPQPDVSFRNPEIFAPAAQPLYQPQVTAKPATSGAEGVSGFLSVAMNRLFKTIGMYVMFIVALIIGSFTLGPDYIGYPVFALVMFAGLRKYYRTGKVLLSVFEPAKPPASEALASQPTPTAKQPAYAPPARTAPAYTPAPRAAPVVAPSTPAARGAEFPASRSAGRNSFGLKRS